MGTDADRHLVFGLVALQNGLINQDQLLGAFRAWSLDKARPLAEHLIGRGDLDPDDRAAVEALVDRHLKKHGGDAGKSLASLPVGRSTRESLARIGDPDIEGTLARVSARLTRRDDDEADRTASYAVGTATSDGLRFRVLRPHAKGGLGAVFVALDAELHREVALKQILDQHADDPTSRSRFLLEAEITGGLEHPGIVPVYGLGSYADGRPYYAMRFIRGDSLKEAADRFHADEAPKADPGRRSLELRKLLKRFQDVCNAIEYAHSRGVLHRDIKPGNIIVGKHGETLVVDWGLAKATGRTDSGVHSGERTLVPSSSSGSTETLPGSALGTPAYMSPEQAEGDLEHLGARSDVYSLGATLYYLLVGRPPAEGDIGEVLRAVQRGEFRSPRQVDATIDRALEAVCKKAMAHRPADRYVSPKALSEDLERWMADEPVSAWRESLSRRARRWAKRNRTTVTAAAGALLAGMVGLSAVLVVQTRAKADIARALGRETTANVALAAANAELSHSKAAVQARYDLAVEAIKTFHTGVSEDFLLKQERFKDLRDRLLKSASEFYGRLGALLKDETDLPSRKALLLANFELAKLTARVGRREESLAIHRRVLAGFEALAREAEATGRAEPDVTALQLEVAKHHRYVGLVEKELGRRAEARTAFESAAAILRRLAGTHPGRYDIRRESAAAAGEVPPLLAAEGKPAQALAALEPIRDLFAKLAQERPDDAIAQFDLGIVHQETGAWLHELDRRDEARAAYERARAAYERIPRSHYLSFRAEGEVVSCSASLGGIAFVSGRLEDARTAFESVVRVARHRAEAYPAETGLQSDLAYYLKHLGAVLKQMGKPTGALAAYEESLAVAQKVAAANPHVVDFQLGLASSHFTVGSVLSDMGPDKAARSEAEYRSAEAILRGLDDALSRSYLAATYNNLGNRLRATGRALEAEAEYRKALALKQRLVDDNPAHVDTRRRLGSGHQNLAGWLSDVGKPSEAEAEYRAALTHLQWAVDSDPASIEACRNLANTQSELGKLLLSTGKPSEAFESYEAARAVREKLTRDHPKDFGYRDEVASSHADRSGVLRRLGRPADARDDCDKAIAIREALVREAPEVPMYRSHLAGSHYRRALARRGLGDFAGAAGDVRRALEMWGGLSSRTGDEWFETACGHVALASLAGRGGSGVSAAGATSESDAAMAMLRKAIAMDRRDLTAFRNEDALDPLRDRVDFKLLMMDLAMPGDPFAAAR